MRPYELVLAVSVAVIGVLLAVVLVVGVRMLRRLQGLRTAPAVEGQASRSEKDQLESSLASLRTAAEEATAAVDEARAAAAVARTEAAAAKAEASAARAEARRILDAARAESESVVDRALSLVSPLPPTDRRTDDHHDGNERD